MPENLAMPTFDATDALRERVVQAYGKGERMHIQGEGSKFWLQPDPSDSVVSTQGHSGILAYDPEELVITVRSGTSIAVLESHLNEHRQMLSFEPLLIHGAGSIGGTVGANLSGGRRWYAGSVRDSILGVRLLDGQGRILRFGGQVLKNVAGYDVSRLMVGARGHFGLLLDVTLRLWPKPEKEITLMTVRPLEAFYLWLDRKWREGWPITGDVYYDNRGYIRLGGAQIALNAIVATMREDEYEISENHDWIWESMRNHEHAFYQRGDRVWKVTVADLKTLIPWMSILRNDQFMCEWMGRRWWIGSPGADLVQAIVAGGGYVECCYGNSRRQLADRAMRRPYWRELKKVFDPAELFF